MKILIVNDYLIKGGAEQYVQNLKQILEEHGHEVYILCFDQNFDASMEILNYSKEKIINVKPNKYLGKINKIIFNPFLYLKIRRRINQIKPNKIILNNLFYSPLTQIRAMKKYDTFQVIHDYSCICPKSTCIHGEHILCDGYKFNNCSKMCEYHSRRELLKIKLNLIIKQETLRKKYVKMLISPSKCLNQYLKKYGYNSCYINNPINIVETESDLIEYNDKNGYLYVGTINERKGIFHFIDALEKYNKREEIQIRLIGKTTNFEEDKKLKKMLKNNSNIEYLGSLDNIEVIKKIKEAKYLIVPSLWIENYPTTILEGIASKTCVLGSDRGGIPEMIDNGRGILFNIMNTKSILEAIEKSTKISEDDYKKIVNKALEVIKSNNSFNIYYLKIINVLECGENYEDIDS